MDRFVKTNVVYSVPAAAPVRPSRIPRSAATQKRMASGVGVGDGLGVGGGPATVAIQGMTAGRVAPPACRGPQATSRIAGARAAYGNAVDLCIGCSSIIRT